MSEPSNGWARERALWQRWSMMAVGPTGLPPGGGSEPDALTPEAVTSDALTPDALTPDALTLAAFAENRLDDRARASVEAFLAANPEIAADVAAALQAASAPPVIEDAALAGAIARAASLVPEPAGAIVLPFRPARRAVSPWPSAVRWGALAASLALVSWLGFALGSDAYGSLAALDRQSGMRLADELLDPPSGFFGLADTSGT